MSLVACTRSPGVPTPDAGIPNTTLPDTFFGLDLQYDPAEGSVPWPDDAGFDGHDVVRAWLAGGGLWADVQQSRSEYRWEAVDRFVQKAAETDKRVVYVVAMTPGFAVAPERRSTLCAWPTLYPGGCNPPDDWNQGTASCRAPADDYTGPDCTFKEFLVALARRYRSTGTQEGCPETDPQCHGVIHAYELGNEVDSHDWPDSRFWAGTATGTSTATSPEAMSVLAHMVADASDVLRREDPGAVIVAPSFTGSGVDDFDLPDDTPSVNRAGAAYLALSRWLHGATRTEACTRDGVVWTCPIEHPDLNQGRGVIAWHDAWDDFDRVEALPDTFTESWHLDGATGPVDGDEVPVFSVPILFH